MNQIKVEASTPPLLSLKELKSGNFYIGVNDDGETPDDVLYVASEEGGNAYLRVNDFGTPNPATAVGDGNHSCLIRLRDGYILLGLVCDYRGYYPARVDITAYPAVPGGDA